MLRSCPLSELLERGGTTPNLKRYVYDTDLSWKFIVFSNNKRIIFRTPLTLNPHKFM